MSQSTTASTADERLRDEQHLAAIETVGDHAAPQPEQQDGQEAERERGADRGAAARELQHEPRLGHRLHPAADVRDEVAGEEEAVVVACRASRRSAARVPAGARTARGGGVRASGSAESYGSVESRAPIGPKLPGAGSGHSEIRVERGRRGGGRLATSCRARGRRRGSGARCRPGRGRALRTVAAFGFALRPRPRRRTAARPKRGSSPASAARHSSHSCSSIITSSTTTLSPLRAISAIERRYAEQQHVARARRCGSARRSPSRSSRTPSSPHGPFHASIVDPLRAAASGDEVVDAEHDPALAGVGAQLLERARERRLARARRAVEHDDPSRLDHAPSWPLPGR